MRHSIFLSYRRIDTSGHAGRLSDDLERRFGVDSVFRDIGSIDAGRDFVRALDHALSEAQVVVVLIGDTWLTETNAAGQRRLDLADDYVRNEVAAALARSDLVVVPVLVEGAGMPAAADLPEPLQPLTRLQAIELSEARWHYDLDRLVETLQQAGVRSSKRRRGGGALLSVVLGLVLLGAVAALWLWYSVPLKIEGYTGLWYLPNGSYWTVRSEGDLLIVEETHYDSQQVWKRGEGGLTREGMRVDLQPVFDNRPYKYRHVLSLSRDGGSLIGTVTETQSGRTQSLVLKRR